MKSIKEEMNTNLEYGNDDDDEEEEEEENSNYPGYHHDNFTNNNNPPLIPLHILRQRTDYRSLAQQALINRALRNRRHTLANVNR